MKYLALLFFLLGFSGCSVINKQYYYVPSVKHQSVSDRHSEFKMKYSRFKVSDKTGDSIATIATNNGVGQPLLIGPIIFPVIPIGGFFHKVTGKFEMDIDINSRPDYFMLLAIDSSGHKRVSDSLRLMKIAKKAPLKSKYCYMIVNNSLKVPLSVEEFFMGNKAGHSYIMRSDMRFGKVKTMRLVTCNAVLDSTFKNITFKRKSRITFNLLGGS
ncbi:MAG TPA: hypothetical protein VK668_08780 [Mucilaginibacter sp.]|nr:hypothetical protein [Mucilaginibacter sp.]